MNKKKKEDLTLVVIPDVHGRTFWKTAKDFPGVRKVFLGDYVDPYTSIEGISKRTAIDNFKEIIEYARDNAEEVTLLYGNHDVSYFIDDNLCLCRHDYPNHREISGIFKENGNLFNWTYSHAAGGKKFILSHAGIMNSWLWSIANDLGVVLTLEDIYAEGFGSGLNDKTLKDALNYIPESRGGTSRCGSMIWASAEDHVNERQNVNFDNGGITQVAGHTWMRNPMSCKGINLIDNGGIIYGIDTDGNLLNIEDGSGVPEILI